MSEETVYRLGGEYVPASQLPDWHHARGLPWGKRFNGPYPVTMTRMGRQVLNNITVHLANEHGVDPKRSPAELRHVRHMLAHLYGQFREGQEHYHEREERGEGSG